MEHAAAASLARSQPAARASCLGVSARPRVQQHAARVHAKLAMAECPDGSLEIWPVTGSTVTNERHGEEALRIGKGARSTRGRAAWQRYLKEKHARLVLGAPRSPRLIFHLCQHQPLGVEELRWPHDGHGDCARARRLWRASVGPRPAGAHVGGAICCDAAPPEALSLQRDSGRRRGWSLNVGNGQIHS